MTDLLIFGGAAVALLSLLLAGYFSYGRPDQRAPLLKLALIGMTSLQLAGLACFGWLFGTSARHVNHVKWIAPLIFAYLLMWACFGIGFGAAALRHRFKGG
ncbi:MAG: hypothetical protein WCO67_07110 [Betaproteobacteria bacterium]